MASSLDALVAGNAPEDMKMTSRMYEDEEKRNLMLKKRNLSVRVHQRFRKVRRDRAAAARRVLFKTVRHRHHRKRVRTRAERVEKVWMPQSWRLS